MIRDRRTPKRNHKIRDVVIMIRENNIGFNITVFGTTLVYSNSLGLFIFGDLITFHNNRMFTLKISYTIKSS